MHLNSDEQGNANVNVAKKATRRTETVASDIIIGIEFFLQWKRHFFIVYKERGNTFYYYTPISPQKQPQITRSINLKRTEIIRKKNSRYNNIPKIERLQECKFLCITFLAISNSASNNNGYCGMKILFYLSSGILTVKDMRSCNWIGI